MRAAHSVLLRDRVIAPHLHLHPHPHLGKIPLGAFAYPRYRLFWFGQLVTNVGSWMQVLATGWLLVELTNSPAALGLNGAFLSVPLVVASLVGGVVADRIDRYRLLVYTQIAQVVPDVVLAVLVGTGVVQPIHVYVYSVIWGIIRGLSFPARQALVPRLVPDDAIQSAIALNSILWQGAAVFGPVLAGVALHAWGLASPFYLNVGSDALYLIALLFIRLPREVSQPAGQSAWRALREGARYAWEQPQVRALLLVVAAISIFDRSYTQLMPVFARDVYGIGAQGLGVLLAMPAIGTILAAIPIAAWRHLPHRGYWVLGTSAVLALALVVFAASSNLWLALPLLMLVGATATAATCLVNTLLQQTVDDKMRGRVMGFYMDATQGGSYLGALPVGLLAEVWGAPHAVDLAAVVSLLIVVVIGLRTPALRRLA
jgi:MFS family permease